VISDQSLRVLLRSDRAVRFWGDLFRAVIGLAVVVSILLFVLYHAAIVRVMIFRLQLNDFGKFYFSAQYFLDGTDMYAERLATTLQFGVDDTHQFLNMNPPHFHLLLLPLARLEPMTALAVWGFMGLAGLLVSAWLITRELGIRWTVSRVLWSTLAVLACSSTGAVIMTGQLTFHLLPLVTLAWIAGRRQAWLRAGLWLGVIAAVKPNLGLFGLCLIAIGQWRAAFAMGAAVAASFGVGLLIFGWDAHVRWIAAIQAIDWTWAPMNGSWSGFFTRVFQGGASLHPLIAAPFLVMPLTALASLATVGISVRQMARSLPRISADHFFAIGLLAAQLTSPLGWIYYLWLAAGPLLAIWLTARERPDRWRDIAIWLALPGLLWPLPLFAAGVYEWWQPPTFRSIYTWTTLWLWVAVLLDAARVTSRLSPAPDTRAGSTQ